MIEFRRIIVLLLLFVQQLKFLFPQSIRICHEHTFHKWQNAHTIKYDFTKAQTLFLVCVSSDFNCIPITITEEILILLCASHNIRWLVPCNCAIGFYITYAAIVRSVAAESCYRTVSR